MNLSSLRALTWGTVAAAVVSALLLAAVEVGGIEFGLDGANQDRQSPVLPTDADATGSHHGLPSAASRDARSARDSPRR